MIVFLNGTPSSGKTSTARALHELLEAPFYYRSLDDFRMGYRARDWKDDGGTLFQRVLDAYLLSLQALLAGGHDVISESVVTQALVPRYLQLFEGYDVLFVGIRCPLDILNAREDARTDRLTSRAPIDNDAVHWHDTYDVEVDTSRLTPEEAAARVAKAMADPPVPSAFSRLSAR